MIMNDTYCAAVKYVETFNWSVIPLKPGTKLPLIPWREYQQRLPTSEELKMWFKGTQNNLGIVTGSISNIAVIDVDEPKQLDLLTDKQSPITVISRRGRHLYYRFSGETNSASKIADKIDVRGEGGFVVAPPSSIDGFYYRFVNTHINHLLLPEFPRELLGVETRDGGNRAKSNQSVNEPGWIAKTLDEVSGGGARTPNFVKVIGRLHYDRHTPDDIFALLEPVAKTRDYDLNKLRETIDDVTTRYEAGNGRPGKSHEVHTGGSEAEDIESFLKGEETVSWIVPNIVAKGSIGFCAGLPETFKTWIMADLGVAVASGTTWLSLEVTRGRVLFIDQERFKGETRRRFQKLIKGKGMDQTTLNGRLFIQTGSSIRLNIDESFAAFKRKLEEIKPDLIIVDSFATFHTSGENDRQEIQKVLERVKEIRTQFGCTILFIDHEGKSVLNPDNRGEVPDSYKMVGSVGKPAAAETVMTIRKENDTTVVLYHTKSSLAPAVAPIQIQIQDTDNGGVRLITNGQPL